jgi:phospholipase C
MTDSDRDHRLDHVVVVMFEKRSFDNLLGYLYQSGEVPAFEGVAGRNLSNPIPSDAPGAERNVVPLHPAANSDTPDPDPGEEYPHINTQLYRTVAPVDNRFAKIEAMKGPFNAPDDPSRPRSLNRTCFIPTPTCILPGPPDYAMSCISRLPTRSSEGSDS